MNRDHFSRAIPDDFPFNFLKCSTVKSSSWIRVRWKSFVTYFRIYFFNNIKKRKLWIPSLQSCQLSPLIFSKLKSKPNTQPLQKDSSPPPPPSIFLSEQQEAGWWHKFSLHNISGALEKLTQKATDICVVGDFFKLKRMTQGTIAMKSWREQGHVWLCGLALIQGRGLASVMCLHTPLSHYKSEACQLKNRLTHTVYSYKHVFVLVSFTYIYIYNIHICDVQCLSCNYGVM